MTTTKTVENYQQIQRLTMAVSGTGQLQSVHTEAAPALPIAHTWTWTHSALCLEKQTAVWSQNWKNIPKTPDEHSTEICAVHCGWLLFWDSHPRNSGNVFYHLILLLPESPENHSSTSCLCSHFSYRRCEKQNKTTKKNITTWCCFSVSSRHFHVM